MDFEDLSIHLPRPLDRQSGLFLSSIMPCSDVTEILTITLDPEERITHYTLSKRTCGGGVGNSSLLRKWISNRSANEVLSATPELVLASLPTRSTTWEFLTVKHLLAVQCGLKALLGFSDSGPADTCRIVNVSCGAEGTRMEADIRVDVVTSRITACGFCGNCGRPKSVN